MMTTDQEISAFLVFLSIVALVFNAAASVFLIACAVWMLVYRSIGRMW